jgi:hypothetical protein
VQAVENGDASQKRPLAESLLRAYTDARWRRFEVLDWGLFLPPAGLAPFRARDAAIEALGEWDELCEGRSDALAAGAPLNSQEADAWRDLIVQGAISDAHAYWAGLGDLWAVLELTRSVRSRCCIAVLGWGTNSLQFVAAYSTSLEAITAIKALGFVSVADYAARLLSRDDALRQ